MGVRDFFKGAWEMLKEEVESIFKRPVKTMGLQEPQENHRQSNCIELTGNEGQQFRLVPARDNKGMQKYAKILNTETGQIEYVPEYNIDGDTVTEASAMRVMYCTVYIGGIEPSELICNLNAQQMLADRLSDPTYLAAAINRNAGYLGSFGIDGENNLVMYDEQGVREGIKNKSLGETQKVLEEIARREAERAENTQVIIASQQGTVTVQEDNCGARVLDGVENPYAPDR